MLRIREKRKKENELEGREAPEKRVRDGDVKLPVRVPIIALGTNSYQRRELEPKAAVSSHLFLYFSIARLYC